MKLLIAGFCLFISSSLYAVILAPQPIAKSIQNITPYTFTLTSFVGNSGFCSPSCTSLTPNAIQNYQFTTPTGTLILDYDVKKLTQKIGHLTILVTPLNVTITNGLGGMVSQGATAAQINYVVPVPVWQGKFNASVWTNNNWSVSTLLPSWGAANIKVMLTKDAPNGLNYLRIIYPKGSANSGSSPPLPLGGAQFYGAMLKTINTNFSPITLSYYVRFPTTFPFKNGTKATLGKLPGLYGGTGNTGDNLPNGYDGWSTRFMWCDYAVETKQKFIGGGEIVQFTPDADTGLFGTTKGKFLGCGKWKFSPDNKWHNIQQTIWLNDAGKTNGRIDICYDGKPVFNLTGINFRSTSSLNIDGILFQSFFGGSGATYATPISTYADFADFELYIYPATNPPGQCMTNI